jgi:hypothetical protein
MPHKDFEQTQGLNLEDETSKNEYNKKQSTVVPIEGLNDEFEH